MFNFGGQACLMPSSITWGRDHLASSQIVGLTLPITHPETPHVYSWKCPEFTLFVRWHSNHKPGPSISIPTPKSEKPSPLGDGNKYTKSEKVR